MSKTTYACLFLAIFTLSFCSCNEGRRLKREASVPYPSITEAYKEVFPENAFKYIKSSYTFFSQERSPIATFQVLTADYSIMVYKTGILNNTKALNKIIKVKWTDDVDIAGLFHSVVNNSKLMFADADPMIKKARTLSLALDADLVGKAINTDSLISFNLDFRKANGRYDNHKDIDFMATKPQSFLTTKIPVQMVFFQKNNNIYLIISSPRKTEDKAIPNDFLYKLITGG